MKRQALIPFPRTGKRAENVFAARNKFVTDDEDGSMSFLHKAQQSKHMGQRPLYLGSKQLVGPDVIL